jgi:5'-3' exonuclease
MGVKGLYSYLKAYRHTLYPSEIECGPPLRIGFDAMSILYKYKAAYKEFYPSIHSFLEHGHKLFFVFDGKPPAEKEEEVKERREARTEASTQAETLKKYLAESDTATMDAKERSVLEYSIARLEHQGWHMTREIRHDFQKALWDMRVPYVKALGEADDVLADMACAGKLDVVVSTDMDFLLYGVPRLWIPARGLQDSYEEVLLAEVLAGEELSATSFRDAALLCGVEPLRGKPTVPPQKAISWMRHYGSLNAVLQRRAEVFAGLTLENVELARDHFVPRPLWSERIRPDHLERMKESLASF